MAEGGVLGAIKKDVTSSLQDGGSRSGTGTPRGGVRDTHAEIVFAGIAMTRQGLCEAAK